MIPRFLPVLLTVSLLVFSQSAAFSYDENAQQQIQQIQQQLEQQYPQEIQANQPVRPADSQLNQGMTQQFNQGMSQAPDAQQQILQINHQLEQMTQSQSQPAQMAPQMQQMAPQMQQMAPQMQQMAPQMQQMAPQMQQMAPQMQQMAPQMQQMAPQMQQMAPQMQQMAPQMTPQMQQAQMVRARASQQMPLNRTAGFAPSNSQSLHLPVLNSTVTSYTSVNGDVIPNTVDATSGVDILDESLNFHSQVNGQAVSRPSSAMNNQNFNTGVSNACNTATMPGVNNGQGCCPHMHNYGSSSNNGDSSGNGGQISTRAIGAIGAAALLGTFINNGGVGGVIKSVGWDNNRHTRGMSIGGY